MIADRLEAFWKRMAARPRIWLALVVAAQSVFSLGARHLWFSDEIRYADAYRHVREAGKWVVLNLNGQPYPDKPPVYFWFLWILDTVTPVAEPALFFLGAALSGLFFVWSVHALARETLRNEEQALAAGLLVAGCFFFIGVSHYSRMDLLFAAFITLSQLFFMRAWLDPAGERQALRGWVLAGLAALTKGPFGVALPMVAALAFLAWKGRLERLAGRFFMLGAGACALMVAAWGAAAYLVEGQGFVNNILHEQIYRRAVDTFHHKEPFFYYLIVLPCAWLPWTLFPAAAPVGRLFSAEWWRGIWKGRGQAGGVAFMWIMLVSGFVLFSAVSIKVFIYVLPLLAPLAVLTAKGLFDLSDGAVKRFFAWATGLLLLLAAGLVLAPLFLPDFFVLRGLYLDAAILAGLALLLVRLRHRRRAWLAALVLGLAVWTVPVGLVTAPSLDPVMSPVAQARAMKRYISEGYTPAAFKTYSGIYSYYADKDIFETGDPEELRAFLTENPKAVLAIRRKYYERMRPELAGLKIVHEQWLAGEPYLLMVRGDSDSE